MQISNITAYWKQEEYTNSQIDSYIQTILNLIEKQQKELEKKDKIIDLMADRLEFVMNNSGIGLDPEHGMNFTINDIKQYFTKKAEK